ncbi:MAG: hypothetical protein M3Y54_10165 [Bacteroidota bacterium]|nr:hypothetical protein [Bacteroidota bacterium]
MLLYLLVGALVLSTALNFYCLLRLDTRAYDQQLSEELRTPLLPDSVVLQPARPDSLLAARP